MYLVIGTKFVWGGILIALASTSANAASIYLCRSYGGGSFWSSAQCSKSNALMERIVTVPDNMPFEQQVQIGEQTHSEARRLSKSSRNTVVITNSDQHTENECASINARIQQLDSLARLPQSGQTQDRISEERKQLRDRQFRIPCR
jgi:hypothetical protein